MSVSDNPRAIALRVIRRVTEEGAYSTLTLAKTLSEARLSSRDRALANELAYGTLRRMVSLDWALERATDRPLRRTSAWALSVLRLGASQLLFTRIPPHAAIQETVSLAGSRERGFVNAVLRRIQREGVEWPKDGDVESIAVRTGLAAWAVEEVQRLVGDEAEDAARSLATKPSLAIRTNTCRTTVDDLQRALETAGHEVTRGSLHPDTLLIDAVAPARLPGWEEGWFTVQDEASAFVVANGLDPQPGERILDACAAPGGKASHIACRVGEPGFTVAADVSPTRARLIDRLATRLGLSIRALAQDARKPALDSSFDRILVDAPCSGLGAARRRPELLWRPQKEQLSGLARLQVAIVSATAELLEPGGRLVFSVCTFPRAETDAACEAILRHREDLEPVELEGPDGPAPKVRLWPHRHGTDAMFVAAFRRRN